MRRGRPIQPKRSWAPAMSITASAEPLAAMLPRTSSEMRSVPIWARRTRGTGDAAAVVELVVSSGTGVEVVEAVEVDVPGVVDRGDAPVGACDADTPCV